MTGAVKVKFQVNGKDSVETVSPSMSLADFLHEHKNLTATRVCCGIGVCRACTVAVKRPGSEHFAAERSCITPVSSLEGASIRTTESLTQGEKLHALQESFLKNFAFQCGYSTSGFLMGAFALIDRLAKQPIGANQVDEAILEAVGDNICRCTGYLNYYAAIKEVILATPGLIKSAPKA